jgi:hypothetical protein
MQLGKTLMAVVLGSTVGCATVQPVRYPAEFIPEKHPKQVWLTREDGKEFLLVNPRVEDEEVVGWARGRREQEVRVPLEETARVRARQTHWTRTALVAGLGLVSGGLFLYSVSRDAHGTVRTCDSNSPTGGGQCY